MRNAEKLVMPLCILTLCGAAQAQTSVQFYGLIDAGIAHVKGSRGSSTLVMGGGLDNNQFGFRGTEDLGNGLKAGFDLQAGYEPDDGLGKSTNTNNQRSGATPINGLTFNRKATVSLSGAWGEVRIGRDKVPTYYNWYPGDPLGLTGVGVAVNREYVITGPTTVYASNTVAYHSPVFLNGFTVQAMHYRGENTSGTPTSGDGTGNSLRVAYASGPLFVGVGVGQTNYAAGDDKLRNLAASWNFGVLKVLGIYNNDRAGSLSARGAALGVHVPVGSGTYRAGYSFHRTSAPGEPEARKLSLGYVYALSKQTSLYATVAHVKNVRGSALAVVKASTAPNASSTGYNVGIFKRF
jgi:predicted porin